MMLGGFRRLRFGFQLMPKFDGKCRVDPPRTTASSRDYPLN
jgi:hypothetical protein